MSGEKLLSDRKCSTAKRMAGLYYLNDGGGLRLQVRPNGARYWMLRYTLGGRESTFQIGAYPVITVEEARRKASDARRLVSEGRHPSVERRLQKAKNFERSRATFGAVATEWLERNAKHWSAAHHERNEGLLRRVLFPILGALPIDEISEPMLLNVLRTAYDSGVKESARRARGVAAQIFAYAKGTHRATHNPARELAGSPVLRKPEVRHFEALKPDQVGPFLAKLDKGGVEPVTRAGLLLMLYTGLRDFSLRGARWSEIDPKGRIWTVPGERMKRKEAHSVPLTRQALAVLKRLRDLTDEGPDSFVFASHGKDGFLAENTLRIALHRLGFKVTAHGFRSLLTDVLNENGFNSDAVERQLHHAERDQVRRAYLRSDFLEYRRTMMQWWADWCDAKRQGTAAPALPKNVLPFRRAA